MREFHKDSKINFVDNNDVLVGFDNYQNCCEHFGWFYSDIIPIDIPSVDLHYKPPEDIESYVFDPIFFHDGADHRGKCNYDNMATFKLVNGAKIQYLTLFNSSNGYYGHGFEVSIASKETRRGCL